MYKTREITQKAKIRLKVAAKAMGVDPAAEYKAEECSWSGYSQYSLIESAFRFGFQSDLGRRLNNGRFVRDVIYNAAVIEGCVF